MATRATTRTLDQDSSGGIVRRTVLPGGLRVITESMPSMLSASLGIWVGIGSRDEKPALAGASHYLEHLLFKGTRRRSALQIASALDAVGGELNAFTAKEHTCYYATVLASDLPLAVDVVGDLVTSAIIRGADVENERGVIHEEIAMRDDEPGDAVYDLFSEALFGDSPLGRPVLGTTQSITDLSRNQIAGYYRRRYRPQSMVVAAAGAVDHAEVLRLVRMAFADQLSADVAPDPIRADDDGWRSPAQEIALIDRPTEQAHILLGGFTPGRHDERRYALSVLNTGLGGGMSSRLFQEIREKRGLAYSVGSSVSHYAGVGSYNVYAGCAPRNVDEVLGLIREELDRVAAKGLSAEEVDRAKGQLRGGMVLGMEDTGSRMSRIAKSELSFGEYRSVLQVLDDLAAVTVQEVSDIAAEVLAGPLCLSVVGAFADHDFSAFVAA
ncbi:MAG: insulinase family protein [Actinomycetota bacterium]|nr:insulinase family protein [Actinomycetota bacterium]